MSDDSARPKPRWERIAIVALVLFAVVLVVLLFTNWLQEFVIFGTFNFAVEKIVDASGLSVYLVKGILVIVLVPFFLALREIGKIPFLRGVGRLSRPVAWGIVLCYTSTYFVTMYFAGRGTYFHHLGGAVTATKFYAVTPEGIRFFDTDGFDPKYGIKLKPATPQLIAIIERAKRGDVAKPLVFKSLTEITFFDALTSEAKFWYSRSSKGEIELFSTAGFDPETGDELRPVTREIVAEVRQHQSEIEAKEEGERKQQEENAKLAAAEAEKARLESQEREFRSQYVNPHAPRVLGRTDVAVVLLGDTGAIPSLQEAFARALRERGVEATDGLFRPRFLEDGSAGKLFAADWSLAKRLRLGDFVDAVVLVKASHSATATGELDAALRSAILNLDMKCVDVVRLRPCGSRGVTVKGAGFSDAEALRNSASNAGTEIQTFVRSLGI